MTKRHSDGIRQTCQIGVAVVESDDYTLTKTRHAVMSGPKDSSDLI